mmetsp:Transcript_18838/g.32407  ORF Transcript_18838/g.32407 Transcript_18838/m.32407 type:complete len:106 (-) Transcript_18838:707-1024(-)
MLNSIKMLEIGYTKKANSELIEEKTNYCKKLNDVIRRKLLCNFRLLSEATLLFASDETRGLLKKNRIEQTLCKVADISNERERFALKFVQAWEHMFNVRRKLLRF